MLLLALIRTGTGTGPDQCTNEPRHARRGSRPPLPTSHTRPLRLQGIFPTFTWPTVQRYSRVANSCRYSYMATHTHTHKQKQKALLCIKTLEFLSDGSKNASHIHIYFCSSVVMLYSCTLQHSSIDQSIILSLTIFRSCRHVSINPTAEKSSVWYN